MLLFLKLHMLEDDEPSQQAYVGPRWVSPGFAVGKVSELIQKSFAESFLFNPKFQTTGRLFGHHLSKLLPIVAGVRHGFVLDTLRFSSAFIVSTVIVALWTEANNFDVFEFDIRSV